MRHSIGLAAILATLPALAPAQTKADTAIKLTWGGFVDGYYAWDTGQPVDFDRSFASGALFTTQPSRHNEFNLNLAFLEAKLEGSRVRGRFAIQTGTSVQDNYFAEPAIGLISGPSLSQLIQEGYIGVNVAENVWVEGGIFFSNMGMESWISRDNPTYTRSLVADYSPYYSSGVRALWTYSPKVTLRLDIVNGWQNISENNTGKAAGIRVDYAPDANTTVSYYNFFSDEAGNLLRTFNGIGAKVVRGRATFLAEADYGTQDGPDDTDGSSWVGLLAIARWQFNPKVALVGRAERFDDEDQVILATGFPGVPFEGSGGSIGVDIIPLPRFLWRTEARGWANPSTIFWNRFDPAKDTSLFFVSSLAMTF